MNTQTLYQKPTPFYKKLGWFDWLFAILSILGAGFSQKYLAHHMDTYEVAILWSTVVGIILLGWFFKPLRLFLILSTSFAYLGIYSYQGDLNLGSGEQATFLLKYFVSSQAAIMWMCALTFLATLCYLIGTILPKKNVEKTSNTALNLGSLLAWTAALMGTIGLLVRWHESYLISPDVGHIPVSNLYEVFVLFIVFTIIMYLYYEIKFHAQRMGVFVFTLLSITVCFLLWYAIVRQAQEIQPLVPALQSWWMKIHVPANFIGYGAFAIAAMLGVAQLLVLSHIGERFLPKAEVLEEVMYKAISLGFLFFTIATILGALWAAEAWGRYWSWDPKETWAFIVWLNYAIWLHLRLVSGWRGKVLAWWAVIGLLITAFAFIGVNMFLSGLHSYGTL
ncbi:c-type cytochrome biogenesis protein CcsB [Neisseria sp. Ec49-e6-T10]|uniref:c-type cytochrome biogenesis protein CcsB n=1 Tax=Neisseria sp. Ec49-e6-T10 TaxID=3140744 RepID=UPI003EC0C4E5